MSTYMFRDSVAHPDEAVKAGLRLDHAESGVLGAKGTFIIELHDEATGELLDRRVKDNIITYDAGILAAMLFSARTSSRGLYMLAVGTGATGPLLNPDTPDPRQRQLNAEIARKEFATVQFRNSDGTASAVPTNIVDFTTTFGSGEATGPLNEMGLISPVSTNPLVLNPVGAAFPTYDTSVDLTNFDVLINYLSFSVISKPATAVMTISWRLTM